MPDTPTPQEYAEQYRATRARVIALLADVGDATATATVVPACPDWNVQQLACHLTGTAAALVARDGPAGDTQAWIDGHVAARSGVPLTDVLAEWGAAGPALEGIVERYPQHFAGLVYDAVAHEYDLREALGVTGDRDGDAVRVALALWVELLGRDLDAHGLPAVRLRAGDDEWIAGSGPPELAIDTDPYELFRLLGSRRSRAQLLAAPWDGDVERFLPALAHMPLPEHDLVG